MLQRYMKQSDVLSDPTQANPSLDYSKNGVNARLALQAVQRPLYEFDGQRMGNARWCQLPLQLPCHEKAVSLSLCFPAKPRVDGQFSRQALCARQSAFGEKFQGGSECNRPAGVSFDAGVHECKRLEGQGCEAADAGRPVIIIGLLHPLKTLIRMPQTRSMTEDLSDAGAPALANAAGSMGKEAKLLLQPDRPIETDTNGQRVLAKTSPSGIGNGSSATTTLPGADAELQGLMRNSPFLDLSSPMTPYEWLKCLLMVRPATFIKQQGAMAPYSHASRAGCMLSSLTRITLHPQLA